MLRRGANRFSMETAALGFRVKSGWALAVLGNLGWYAHRDAFDLDDMVFAMLVQVVTGVGADRCSLEFLREQAGFAPCGGQFSGQHVATDECETRALTGHG